MELSGGIYDDYSVNVLYLDIGDAVIALNRIESVSKHKKREYGLSFDITMASGQVFTVIDPRKNKREHLLACWEHSDAAQSL